MTEQVGGLFDMKWLCMTLVGASLIKTQLQDKCYQLMAKRMVDHVLSGYFSCLFCYGQTGTGKTTTIMGKAGGLATSRNLNSSCLNHEIKGYDIVTTFKTTLMLGRSNLSLSRAYCCGS